MKRTRGSALTDDLSPCDKLAIRHETLVDENIKLRAEIDELQQVARKSYMDLQREYMILEKKYHDLKEQHDVSLNPESLLPLPRKES